MAGTVKVKGIPVELGGVIYVMPPLSLGVLEQMGPKITAFDPSDFTQMGTVIDIAHASLARNYPELTREQVGEIVDLGNFQEVFTAVMDVSGLKRKVLEAGEARPPETSP